MTKQITISKTQEREIRDLICKSESLNSILPEKYRTFNKPDLLRTANFFYYVGDLGKAIEYCAKVLVVEPMDETARHNMSVFLSEQTTSVTDGLSKENES